MNEKFNPDAMRQQMDQMGSMLKDMAPVLRQFYQSLVVEGFTPAEALTLVCEYISSTFGSR